MTRRALITGIAGQDGSYLAELLLLEGYEVYGVVRPGAGPFPNLGEVADRIELLEADLLHRTSLVQALQAARPREVYNLAAPSFVPVRISARRDRSVLRGRARRASTCQMTRGTKASAAAT